MGRALLPVEMEEFKLFGNLSASSTGNPKQNRSFILYLNIWESSRQSLLIPGDVKYERTRKATEDTNW